MILAFTVSDGYLNFLHVGAYKKQLLKIVHKGSRITFSLWKVYLNHKIKEDTSPVM